MNVCITATSPVEREREGERERERVKERGRVRTQKYINSIPEGKSHQSVVRKQLISRRCQAAFGDRCAADQRALDGACHYPRRGSGGHGEVEKLINGESETIIGIEYRVEQVENGTGFGC